MRSHFSREIAACREELAGLDWTEPGRAQARAGEILGRLDGLGALLAQGQDVLGLLGGLYGAASQKWPYAASTFAGRTQNLLGRVGFLDIPSLRRLVDEAQVDVLLAAYRGLLAAGRAGEASAALDRACALHPLHPGVRAAAGGSESAPQPGAGSR